MLSKRASVPSWETTTRPQHFAASAVECHNLKSQKVRRRIPVILALAIVITQCAVMLFFAIQKQGFFVDELWSYGLSNSLFFPHLFGNGAMDGNWVTPNVLHSYLEVDPGQQFRFDSVVYNLANDAHPPLFFLVLHFVCSLFPGTFSKWYGIVPNLVYFIISAVLMYRLMRRVLGNDYKALLPLLWWGFCPGTISLVLFIRMYMMASMFVLLLLNVHYDILVARKETLGYWISLLAASFLGLMCHYYMYIFAFFLAVCSCIYLLLSKRWKAFVEYAGIMVGSVLLAFLVFPAAIGNFLGNGYAQEGTANRSVSDVVGKICGFYSITDGDLFGNVGLLQTIVLFVAIGGLIVSNIRKSRGMDGFGAQGYCVALLFTCGMFFIVAAVVSPWFSSRYVSFIYPPAIIVSTYGINSLIDVLASNSPNVRWGCGIAAVCVIMGISVPSYGSCVEYRYPEEKMNLQAVASENDPQVIFVSSNYYKIVVKALELENTEGALASIGTQASIDCAVSQVNPNARAFLVLIDPSGLGSYTVQDVLNEMVNDSRFDRYQHLDGYQVLKDGAELDMYEVIDDAA